MQRYSTSVLRRNPHMASIWLVDKASNGRLEMANHPTEVVAVSAYSFGASRRSRRRTFPIGVFGKTLRNSTWRGTL